MGALISHSPVGSGPVANPCVLLQSISDIQESPTVRGVRMKAFYERDRREQLLTVGVFAIVLVMVVLGIALKSPFIGLAAVLGACGSVIWLARCRSRGDGHGEGQTTESDRPNQ